MASLYRMNIQQLDKIGPKKAEQFEKLGIDSVGSLLRYYPRDYEDWSKPYTIAEAPINETCCVRARIESASPPARIRGNMVIYKLVASDGNDCMTVTLFNQGFLYDRLSQGGEYLFYGAVKRGRNGFEMASPKIDPVSCECIRPIYSHTSSLSGKQIENAVRQAAALLPKEFNDPIPHDIRTEYGLCDLGFAIKNIHFPENIQALKDARKRLVFEELLILQLCIGMRSNGIKECHGYRIEKDYTDEFLRQLPFKPTNAQLRVIDECVSDMQKPSYQLHRLIQGDVGSGKTAVAAAVCYTAAKNGLQCAFMAPTEILAEQHFFSLTELFSRSGLKIELLTGSTRASEKKRILSQLLTGNIDILIGTHALLSDNVIFNKLGLVITDEQHRFGVAQRAALSAKGNSPHMIIMSATPIPRTLAIILFGDLDLSIIDELPPGRQKTETYLVDSSKRERIYRFILKHINEKKQCYIVCPLVEQGESALFSAEEYYTRLKNSILKDCRIAVLHGKMNPAEKESVMESFSSGETDILIATTVIEVGVNVPNAVIMLIENAERFGLSQLHQLRGRVGRGTERSYCIMVSDNESPATKERLNVLCKSTDGFFIADEDLRLRGPGDLFGTRQHGLPELKIAGFSDMPTLEQTRSAAESILSNDPGLSLPEHKALLFEVRRMLSSDINA